MKIYSIPNSTFFQAKQYIKIQVKRGFVEVQSCVKSLISFKNMIKITKILVKSFMKFS